MEKGWLGLEDQVVIVTGGASGIGKHVVQTLTKAGAKAVVADMTVNTGGELDGAWCGRRSSTMWWRSTEKSTPW